MDASTRPTKHLRTFFSWVFDDLYMYGRSIIHITSRTADGFPASFQRLAVGSITTTDQTGPVWFAPSNQVYFNGVELDTRDLLQILSPTTGLVYTSVSAVETALKLKPHEIAMHLHPFLLAFLSKLVANH